MKHRYALCLCVNLAVAAHAEFDLSNVFTRNMVLQREARNPVFGTAEPGAEVRIAFGNQEKTGVADADGNWLVWLDPMSAESRERELVAQSGSRTEKVPGIVIGDVWLAAGDQQLAGGMNPGELQRAGAVDDPLIRLYLCRMETSPYPLYRYPLPSMYVLADSKSVSRFPASLYAFARAIRAEEDVPVGFFNCSGRFSLSGALPSRAAAYLRHPANAQLAAKMRAASVTEAEGKAAYGSYAAAMRVWIADARTRVEQGLYPEGMPEVPNADMAFGGDFNARVHPVHLFPIRGVIWHVNDRANYTDPEQGIDLYQALIKSWRDLFRNPGLPFYFIQHHHPNGVENNPAKQNRLALIQSRMLELPHTGLAVTYDVHDRKSWDLASRYDAGLRLSRWALRDVYGKDVEPQGPTFGGMDVRDGGLEVVFTHVGEGLAGAPGSAVNGFAVAGTDRRWQWAKAELVTVDRVRVWSEQVADPAFVAYAVNNSPDKPDLYSRDGLPALPFSEGKDVR